MNIFNEASYFIICYLIGSIPSGLIIGKLFKNIDIREHGSGNLGGTNAIRVLGKTLGLIVAFMDLMKGGVAILLAQYVFRTEIPTILLFGIAAVIGHMFPIFAKFRGGKAVATSGGVLLFASLPIFLTGISTFFISLVLTKYVSLSSTIVAMMIFISAVIAFIFKSEPFFVPFKSDIYLVITNFILFSFVIWRHIPNYKRLLSGTESKVGKVVHKNN